MDPKEKELLQETYIPLVAIQQITIKHMLARIQIAHIQSPQRSCGYARRVGMTGKLPTSLAIYRLKIQQDGHNAFITLPALFVVDKGKFIDYEIWKKHSSETMIE